MKPGYVSKRSTSFPILEFLVLLFIFQCSLVLAETPDGHIPESPASPAPNAEETESESVPPAATTPAPSADTQTTSELQPTSKEPLPPVPTKPEAENTGRFRRHLDFFGMNLGGGGILFMAEEKNRFIAMAKIHVQLFNIRLNYLYFTVLDVYLTPIIGLLGGGIRAGYRHPLRTDWKSEIRFGGSFGVGNIVFSPFSTSTDSINLFPLSPHFEYVYNTRHGTVGLGIEIPVYFHRVRVLEIYGDRYHLPAASIGFGVYFHFSVGRIELKHREREDLDVMDKNQESGVNP